MHTVVVGTVGVVEGVYYELVATYGARVSKSVVCVSGGEVMSVRIGSTLNVATYSTLSCYCASRSGVVVTLSCNGLLSLENFLTYGTLLTSGKTCCGTGRSYCCDSFLGVTGSFSGLTMLASATSTSVNGVTVLGTCGRNNLTLYVLTNVLCCATSGARAVYEVVSESLVNYVLCVKYLVTGFTVSNYVMRTVSDTRVSNFVLSSGFFVVTESFALSKAASGTVLSVFAISICPNVLVLVEEPLALLLCAEVDVVKCEAGTCIGIATHVEAVDIKVLNGLACDGECTSSEGR